METDQRLVQFFENSYILPDESVKYNLSYDQMLMLADSYFLRTMEPQMTVEDAPHWIKLSKDMQDLAELVGPEWTPLESKNFSQLGFPSKKFEIDA